MPTQIQKEHRNFLIKTYAFLILAFLITALSSLFFYSIQEFFSKIPGFLGVLLNIALGGLLILILVRQHENKMPLIPTALLLLSYSVLSGFVLSLLFKNITLTKVILSITITIFFFFICLETEKKKTLLWKVAWIAVFIISFIMVFKMLRYWINLFNIDSSSLRFRGRSSSGFIYLIIMLIYYSPLSQALLHLKHKKIKKLNKLGNAGTPEDIKEAVTATIFIYYYIVNVFYTLLSFVFY